MTSAFQTPASPPLPVAKPANLPSVAVAEYSTPETA
jgi:hypothetical protein